MDALRNPHGSPVELPCWEHHKSANTPSKVRGSTGEVPWKYHGYPIGSALRTSHGSLIESSWESYESTTWVMRSHGLCAASRSLLLTSVCMDNMTDGRYLPWLATGYTRFGSRSPQSPIYSPSSQFPWIPHLVWIWHTRHTSPVITTPNICCIPVRICVDYCRREACGLWYNFQEWNQGSTKQKIDATPHFLFIF